MSATGEPQRASDVPADLTIITADEITRSGATTIPDVLRLVAGIDVRSYGVADSAVGIRGDNTALNPRVLVLLDGRQVLQNDYGLTVWQLIPVALGDIRQIEIIKGPNSALHGFDAVSGLINIITYDALDDHVNAARVEGGSLKALDGGAVASVRATNMVGIRLSATGSRPDEYGASGQTPFNQPRSGNLAIDLHARPAPRADLLLEASVGSREPGGELTLKGQDQRGFRWTVGYALALVHDETSEQVPSDASSVAFEDQTPTHAVTLWLGDTWGRLDADLQARWQLRFLDYRLPPGALSLQPVSVPNHPTLDPRLAYRLTRGLTRGLTLAVVGDQPNHSDQIESAGARTEGRGFASASLRF